jgi:parallel beta-helix repeat protein
LSKKTLSSGLSEPGRVREAVEKTLLTACPRYWGQSTVLKNHILDNYSATGGGGVYFGNYVGDCWIEDNKIEEDTSPGGGGGIFVHARNCSIRRNVITNNRTVNRGGGIKLEYDLGQGGPYPSTADTNITDNLIVSNHLTGSDPKGGGILAWDWPRAARRNVVKDNDSNGIYVRVENVGALDMGNADDPGLNVLMGNGKYDLVDTSVGLSPTAVQAIGDYWGYLDTHTMRGRILSFPSSNVAYDPVGASSRWFDVDLAPVSTCSTDVLVTGDLQVKHSLTITEGRTLRFYLCPDTSLGNSSLTELIVLGSGTVLTSVGTAEDSIKYLPQAIASSSGRYWYGIEMLSGTEGYFGRCVIERAHCGIDVEPDGMAEVDDSRLDSCVFAGAYGLQGSLDVEYSDVSCNGGYGIRYEALDGEADHFGVGYCTINSNVNAGVYVAGIGPARLPEYDQITHNTIDGNGVTLYGVQAEDEANWPGIFENDISGCVQAGVQFCGAGPTTVGNIVQSNLVDGIHCEGHEVTLSSNVVHDNGLYGIFFCQGSGGYVYKNIVQDNGVCGIACFDGSNSLVRENTVTGHPTGVSCDLTSFPDLGTFDEPGLNSILFDNTIWVSKDPQSVDSVQARGNYWGADPSSYPGKFVGPVAYAPWLPDPPDEGGQQAAGTVVQPLVTELGPVQPAPIRSAARIPFQVARAGQVVLSIVDASGRVVRVLVHGDREAGRYNVAWNRNDDHGRTAPAGVYFCTLSAENKRFCRKVILTE